MLCKFFWCVRLFCAWSRRRGRARQSQMGQLPCRCAPSRTGGPCSHRLLGEYAPWPTAACVVSTLCAELSHSTIIAQLHGKQTACVGSTLCAGLSHSTLFTMLAIVSPTTTNLAPLHHASGSFSLLPEQNMPGREGVAWFSAHGQDQTFHMCVASGTRSPGTVVLVVPGSPG